MKQLLTLVQDTTEHKATKNIYFQLEDEQTETVKNLRQTRNRCVFSEQEAKPKKNEYVKSG